VEVQSWPQFPGEAEVDIDRAYKIRLPEKCMTENGRVKLEVLVLHPTV
jgi:hypothetical protein